MKQNRKEKLFHAQIHLKNGTQPIFVASDTGEFHEQFVPPHGGGMEIIMKRIAALGIIVVAVIMMTFGFIAFKSEEQKAESTFNDATLVMKYEACYK